MQYKALKTIFTALVGSCAIGANKLDSFINCGDESTPLISIIDESDSESEFETFESIRRMRNESNARLQGALIGTFPYGTPQGEALYDSRIPQMVGKPRPCTSVSGVLFGSDHRRLSFRNGFNEIQNRIESKNIVPLSPTVTSNSNTNVVVIGGGRTSSAALKDFEIPIPKSKSIRKRLTDYIKSSGDDNSDDTSKPPSSSPKSFSSFSSFRSNNSFRKSFRHSLSSIISESKSSATTSTNHSNIIVNSDIYQSNTTSTTTDTCDINILDGTKPVNTLRRHSFRSSLVRLRDSFRYGSQWKSLNTDSSSNSDSYTRGPIVFSNSSSPSSVPSDYSSINQTSHIDCTSNSEFDSRSITSTSSSSSVVSFGSFIKCKTQSNTSSFIIVVDDDDTNSCKDIEIISDFDGSTATNQNGNSADDLTICKKPTSFINKSFVSDHNFNSSTTTYNTDGNTDNNTNTETETETEIITNLHINTNIDADTNPDTNHDTNHDTNADAYTDTDSDIESETDSEAEFNYISNESYVPFINPYSKPNPTAYDFEVTESSSVGYINYFATNVMDMYKFYHIENMFYSRGYQEHFRSLLPGGDTYKDRIIVPYRTSTGPFYIAYPTIIGNPAKKPQNNSPSINASPEDHEIEFVEYDYGRMPKPMLDGHKFPDLTIPVIDPYIKPVKEKYPSPLSKCYSVNDIDDDSDSIYSDCSSDDSDEYLKTLKELEDGYFNGPFVNPDTTEITTAANIKTNTNNNINSNTNSDDYYQELSNSRVINQVEEDFYSSLFAEWWF
ncbi:uncharacterized protein RJT21DRAFT_133026 [Scheffersomyces amazonensis]|uniref:uncharacterized protein n=1 Tax=Scheffersomyces amazonensis TaxID=1078765 RepID=UPI00315C86A4